MGRRILWLQLAWSTGLLALWAAYMGTSPLDEDYASGELLDHSLGWIERGTLYAPPTDEPYRVLNYPPLLFFLVRALTMLGVPTLAAGRLINLVAMAVCLVLVYLWLRQAGCDARRALWSLGLAGSSVTVIYLAGQYHLQWLAVGLSLAGLYLLATGRSAAAAGVLCALACLTKQTQVVSALVAVGWLSQRDRPRLAPFLRGFLAATAAGWATFTLFFGVEMWRHLVDYTVGMFSLRILRNRLVHGALPWVFLVAFAVWLGVRSREGRRDLRWWYFCGMCLALLSAARTGSSYQYFLEWSLATILWIGPHLGLWLRTPAMVGLLFVQLVVADVHEIRALRFMYRHHLRDQRLVAEVGPWLPPAPALILGEKPGVVRTCGHIPALQPFIVANLSGRGLFDDRLVIRNLEARRYPVILLPFDVRTEAWKHTRFSDRRWTPATLAAVERSYREVTRVGRWRVLYPK